MAMSRVVANERLTARLRDGRTLCFAEYGAPDGVIVVNAHGGLACRLDVQSAAAAAHAAGVRLISPDRPGIGGSDAQPGRTIRDWADDVAQLVDILGAGRFAAMGWSMGGPYAAALGAAMPHRVMRVAIIAGALPLSEPGVFSELPMIDRAYTRLSQHVSWLARLCFSAMGATARVLPSWYGKLAARQLGSADAAVLGRLGYASFARMSAEAMSRTSGVVEDYRAWMRPWGFSLEAMTVPVAVWAGVQDRLIDPRWPQELARRIPDARLHLRPGGHFLAPLYYPEIFEELLH